MPRRNPRPPSRGIAQLKQAVGKLIPNPAHQARELSELERLFLHLCRTQNSRIADRTMEDIAAYYGYLYRRWRHLPARRGW